MSVHYKGIADTSEDVKMDDSYSDRVQSFDNDNNMPSYSDEDESLILESSKNNKINELLQEIFSHDKFMESTEFRKELETQTQEGTFEALEKLLNRFSIDVIVRQGANPLTPAVIRFSNL